jgi:O-antigen/teichoic acid export membrane protein
VTGTTISAWKLLASRVSGVAGCLVLGQVLVGVTTIIAARSMSPADLGLVATCFAIGAIGSTVFDGGLTGYLIREVGCGNIALARARALVRAKRRLTPVLVVPTLLICALIIRTPVEAIVLGLIGWVIWEAQTAGSLLRAQEMFTRATTAQLSGRVLGLVTTAVLIIIGPAERALAIGLMSSFAAEAVIGRVLLGPARSRAATQRDLYSVQRRSLSFGLLSLAAMGQQLDTPLVTAGGGATAGGIYAAAGRLIGPLLFLSSSLSLVGAPWLARSRHDPDKLWIEERRIKRLAATLSLGPLAAAAVGPFVIPVLLGPEYRESGYAFVILAAGALLSTLSQGQALILQNRGAEKKVGTTIAVGLVLGLLISFLAAAVGGPVWAATGFAASQLYINVVLTAAARKIRASSGPQTLATAANPRDGG